MPPVRWKLLSYAAILTLVQISATAAQHMQDTFSVSSDGWRPIVGTRRQPPSLEKSPSSNGEIAQYANPNRNSEIVKADNFKSDFVTPPPKHQEIRKRPVKHVSPSSGNGVYKKSVVKTPYKKPANMYYTLPPTQQGHNRPSQQVQGYSTIGKYPQGPPAPPGANTKRKPVKGQAVAQSNRNEVFAPPPPPSSDSFSIVKSVSGNLKTRETSGVGFLGSNQFSNDFNNRFALPDDSIFQRPVPTFVFAANLPDQNGFKTQNDDFTRNLLPPPMPRGQVKQKVKTTQVKNNVAAATEPQFGAKPLRNTATHAQLQAPPLFEQNFAFSSQKHRDNQPAADVEVIKQQIKHFPNAIPSGPNFNSPLDYVDIEYHTVPRPSNLPGVQTYEVTEGKFSDSQDPFQFRFQKVKNSAKPSLLFQDPSPTAPVFEHAPVVEINVPFLPTPFRPTGVAPTSATQSEISTIFSHISNKLNKNNEAVSNSPLFFDVKEVSTHYPILGLPERKPETETDTPLPMQENGEISNDITTVKEESVRQPGTTQDPTRTRVNQRRRPRPRRPSTTTTTTEAPAVVEQSVSVQEGDIERPQQRRKRPRPNRYRTNPNRESSEERPTRHRYNQNEAEDGQDRYKSSTFAPENDETTTKQRGRYRYRPKPVQRNGENYPNRIRTRPTTAEPNERDTSTESELTISNQETIEQDDTGVFDRVPEQSQQEGADAKPELTTRNEETQNEEQVEATFRPHIEEIITEDIRNYNYRTSTTEYPSTNVNLPENEVDYSTPSQDLEGNDEDAETTTQSTTTPESTTKSNRIRGRPMKYDSSNRPKFSVKDYRQRLNQYTSTTQPTTTDKQRTPSDGLRLRFPPRLRTKVSSTVHTTANSRMDDDEDTTEVPQRHRFKPKDPRYQTATPENDLVITEKSVKSVNTRLRPFGRVKSTTEETVSTTTPKVSIRPNLFSARRRAQIPSLKTRIQNKRKNETEEVSTTTGSDSDDAEIMVTTDAVALAQIESSTEFSSSKTSTEVTSELPDVTTEEDTKHDASFDYSQRVSDLTSSFKDQYDTPGLFKSIQPSRRVPSYFTISTEDPVLPLEAFFTSIKDKDKNN